MREELVRKIARLPRGRPKKSTTPLKRDKRTFHSLPVTEIVKTMPLSVLPISPDLVAELTALEFRTVGDLEGLTALHAIQIPGMNGQHWRTITRALGRNQFPER